MPPQTREPQRIAKLLARAGVASRRDIERMIAAGRIAIDGQVLATPATLVETLRGVTVDGAPVAAAEPTRLFRYHKPAGTLTAERDPGGRPTIYDRMPDGLPRLIPVGRLDLATEGLLLLTTDGGLKRRLELPATGVERTYRARAYGDVSQAQLEDLMLGTEVDGVVYGPINANLERRTGANLWIEMTLTEGKNREVRRVLEHLGLRVSRLIRTRYGPFVLGDLPEAEVEEVRQHELVAFQKSIAGRPTARAAPAGADPQALKAWRRDTARPRPAATTAPSNRDARSFEERMPTRHNDDRPLRTREDASRPRVRHGDRDRSPRSGEARAEERPDRRDPDRPSPSARSQGNRHVEERRLRPSARPVRNDETETRPTNSRGRRAAAFASAHGIDAKRAERPQRDAGPGKPKATRSQTTRPPAHDSDQRPRKAGDRNDGRPNDRSPRSAPRDGTKRPSTPRPPRPPRGRR